MPSTLNAVCFLLSCSVVCEIGPAKRVPPGDVPFEPTLSGVVTVKVNGNRQGSSEVVFTYRVGHVITAPPYLSQKHVGLDITIAC